MSGEIIKSEFVQNVESALKDANTVHVLNIFQDNKNVDEVKNNSWDLIPIISQYLTESNELNNNKVFHCCEKLIDLIADRSNAEETLLQLIEEIEECKDDKKFQCLLPCLKKVLFRLPTKRISSFAWGFNAVQTYLNNLELPEDSNLWGKEKVALHSDDSSNELLRLLGILLAFYKEFIDELHQSRNELFGERAAVLVKFLVQILGKPLCHFDLDFYDDFTSEPRKIAESLLKFILSLQSDPFQLIEVYFDKAESNEITKPHLLGISVLFYLILGEGIEMEKIPQIYDPFYKFQLCLPLCTELFQTNNNRGAEKGIKLTMSLLNGIKDLKLSYLVLDSPNHSQFCKILSNVIIYNQTEQIRKDALKIFEIYLSYFETKGFYLLVVNLLSKINHGGLLGFITTKYKDVFAKEMNNEQISIYCKGEKLLKIFKTVQSIYIDEKVELINFLDYVTASLNFLLFAFMRDKNNNSGIWNWVELFEEKYWNSLKKSIQMLRGYYEAKIIEVNEGTDSQLKKGDTEVSINVCGELLKEMSKEEQLKMLNSSLTAFDLIDCILSRLTEFVNTNRKIKL